MAIIRSDLKKLDTRIILGRVDNQNDDEIPFIPAYDLYEAQKKCLTTEEAAAVAVALMKLLPSEDLPPSAWGTAAKLQGLR